MGLAARCVEHLENDAHCAQVIGLVRHSTPAVDLLNEASIQHAAAWLDDPTPQWDPIVDITGILAINGHGPEKDLGKH